MNATWKFGVVFVLLAAACLAAEPAAVDLAKISRAIGKQPPYRAEPHYALLVFGPRAQHRSWMVMDGDDVLYFDRNGNGDLTDAEDRIECDRAATDRIKLPGSRSHSAMHVFPIGVVAGVKLELEFWVRNRAYVPTDDWHKQVEHERNVNNWENSTLWRVTEKAGQAQNPVLLTATPADAQITHFGGPLVFAFKWDEKQKLEPWPKRTTFDVHIGTRSLPPKNCPYELFAPLTELEPPRHLHPTAVFKFPPRTAGGPPVELVVDLDQRCCGDTFYAQMAVPREAGEGRATVVLTYPAWAEGAVQPTILELPIGGEPRSSDPAQSFVMFKWNPVHDFDAAMAALRAEGLTFRRMVLEDKSELIRLQIRGKPGIVITLNTKPDVLETSKALGSGTSFETALSASDARFDVSICPATLVAEEQETLKRVYAALARQTGGTVYTTWDKRLFASPQK